MASSSELYFQYLEDSDGLVCQEAITEHGSHLVGILVYGGVDPVSGVELGNAFESHL